MASYLSRPSRAVRATLASPPGASLDAIHRCELSMDIALTAVTGQSGNHRLERFTLDPQKTLEREALLRRMRELDIEIAQLSAISGR